MTRSAPHWIAALVLITSCAHLPSADPVAELRKESMTKEAFERILPRLEKLKPGDDLGSIEELSDLYRVRGRGESGSHAVFMPGWICSMSGGMLGGVCMFGAPVARSGRQINGRHVFGYVWGEMNLAPRYLLVTQATAIEKGEYDALAAQKVEGIGFIDRDSRPVHFKDLRVAETRVLPFGEPSASATATHELVPADLESGYTEQAFRETEGKLSRLQVGADEWTLCSELGALFITRYYCESHVALVKGFMNRKGPGTRLVQTEEATYALRPFGYVQGDEEVTKLIAVFKNDSFEKVVPYSGSEDWRSYLDP